MTAAVALALSAIVSQASPMDADHQAAIQAATQAVARSIASAIAPHWTLHCDPPAQRLRFHVQVGPDGGLIGSPTLLTPVTTVQDRVAADSARRALVDAAPYATPEGSDRVNLVFVFDAEAACAAGEAGR